MDIKKITDPEFSVYGKELDGVDFMDIIEALKHTTEMPEDKVIYVPSDKTLEELASAAFIRDNIYGGMPIQIGYCNGFNRKLNCLEYHRDTEINIIAEDVVFLVAKKQDMQYNSIETSRVQAFYAQKGRAVQLYETTLHYAPCSPAEDKPFRVAVVLPKGTNTKRPEITIKNEEDKLLWACNKWLIAHEDSNEAAEGAVIGLIGQNVVL